MRATCVDSVWFTLLLLLLANEYIVAKRGSPSPRLRSEQTQSIEMVVMRGRERERARYVKKEREREYIERRKIWGKYPTRTERANISKNLI